MWGLLVSVIALVGVAIAVEVSKRQKGGSGDDVDFSDNHGRLSEPEESAEVPTMAVNEQVSDMAPVQREIEIIRDDGDDEQDSDTIDLSDLSRSDKRMLAQAIIVAVGADLPRTEDGSRMLVVLGLASGVNPQNVIQAFSDSDWREGVYSSNVAEQRLGILAAMLESRSRDYRNLQSVLNEIDMELSEKRHSALTANGVLKRLWRQMKRDLEELLDELRNDDGEIPDDRLESSIPKYAILRGRECNLI